MSEFFLQKVLKLESSNLILCKIKKLPVSCHGIDTQALFFYWFLFYPFICLFKVNLRYIFSETLKLECRMCDGIIQLRLRVVAFVLLFIFIFNSFLILHVNIEKLCHSFLK